MNNPLSESLDSKKSSPIIPKIEKTEEQLSSIKNTLNESISLKKSLFFFSSML